MLKNKKGFTLIELLVAIAIMISITVVAIISITKIGEQNKKQSYELVKDQVKTAALEYFSSNEYWFEGLKEGAVGYITVNKLVNDDYLNSLTNPVTGKKLNGCDYVKVEKTSGIYKYSFETNTGTCKDNTYIAISESGASLGELPKATLSSSCEEGKEGANKWCKGKVTVKLIIAENSKVDSIMYDMSGSSNNKSSDVLGSSTSFTDADNSSMESDTKIVATVTNSVGSIYPETTYKIDNIIPEVTVHSKIVDENYTLPDNKYDNILTATANEDFKNFSNYTGKWIKKSDNKKVLITTTVKEEGPSGVKFDCTYKTSKNRNIYASSNANNEKYECIATAGSGAKDSGFVYINIDKTPPTCNITESNGSSVKIAYDKSSSMSFKLNQSDTGGSGLSKYYISNSSIGNLSNYSNNDNLNLTIGSNNFALYGKVRDNAGNENTCNTGTIAVNTYSDCELVVVADHKTEMVNDWYNIATGQPKIISYVNGSPVKEVDASEGSYSYSFPSGYNCKSTPSSVTVKYDPIVPTVDLIMKKKINSGKVEDTDDISSLSNYTNGEIYKGYVFTKTSYTAGPSGATVSCSDTNYDSILGGTHGPYDNFKTYRNVNREGVTTIKCTATSGAGVKSSEISKTIKLERKLKMVLNEDRMKEVTSVTNGKLVFNTKYSGVKLYSTTDYMGCNKYSSSNTNGCKLGGSFDDGYFGYIGTACKNVGGYLRWFYVDSPVDWNFSTYIIDGKKSDEDKIYGTIYDKQNADYLRTCTNLTSSFNTNCGNKTTGTPNFTTHKYYYKSYSGATSNEVILYAKYTIDCKY